MKVFVSMRTGIVLLVLIIVASVSGTLVLPQAGQPLNDIYHSIWFYMLLGLLCLNIFACSLRRLSVLWQRPETAMTVFNHHEGIKGMPAYRETNVSLSGVPTANVIQQILINEGFRVRHKDRGKDVAFYAERGRMAPWGILAVHLSILIVAVGALYGNLYGFSQDVVLPVGGSCQLTIPNYGDNQSPLRLKLNGFETRYYPDGSVSDWVSDIAVEMDGSEGLRQQVKVNQPLEYAGVRVYQHTFGTVIRTELVDDRDNVVRQADVPEGEVLALDTVAIRPVRYIPDLDPARPMMKSRSTEPRNPHVLYIIYHQGREYAWGTAKIGEAVILGDRLGSIRFTEGKPFSGLQVKGDPGIPVVWSGFMIMAVGFFISLYSRRVQIWLLVTSGDGATQVGMAGRGGIIVMDSVYNKITSPATVAQSKARR